MDQPAVGVDSIFLAALEKNTLEAGSAYLDQVCATDLALRKRVERLLAAHPKAAGSFLESPPEELQRPSKCPRYRKDPARSSAPTSCWSRSAKAAWAWSTWPSSRSRSAARWP